jgi:acetyl esterase/lipase
MWDAMVARTCLAALMLICSFLLGGCQPSPAGNVVGYLAAKRMGRLTPAPPDAPRGALTGLVMGEDGPLAGATVVVAERTGQPYAGVTGTDGRYRIDHIPAGQYAPAAVAPGYAEAVDTNLFGMPKLVTVRADAVSEAPVFYLQRMRPAPLPQPWPAGAHLTLTATGTVTAPFPAGSIAEVQAFTFKRDGVLIDTLRLYLPLARTAGHCLPLLFMVYPTYVDWWQSVSTAYAAQGYALVAISPVAVRGTEILAHAEDARMALLLAKAGALGPDISSGKAVALGGSFSSPILHQLIRLSRDQLTGWVTVGGVSNAFTGAAAFYAGELEIPSPYEYLIPALGMPNLFPLLFLRYSPVYTAAELPPTMIIHTAADRVIPIAQAHELEAALRTAGVPVDAFYYEDVSHYLQIDEYITEAGKEMFTRTLAFAEPLLRGECTADASVGRG